jgi:tetratricopeptide (TPR) repeat protein
LSANPGSVAAPSAPAASTPAPRAAGPLARLFGQRAALPAILALAGLLRLAHVLALRRAPFFDNLVLDPRFYDDWAQRLAAGDWLGRADGPFFVDPLYAYFLGVLYAVVGRSLLLVRLVQAALGVGTVWLTARVGRRVLGSSALGNFAALLMAAFLPAVHAEAAVEKTALATFLLALAADLYLDPSRRAAVASGVALGFAALARGNLLLLVPLGAVGLYLEPVAAGAWRARLARRAAPFLAGALAVVGLATARNAAVGGGFVLTTANAGQNLYIGHHRGNEDGTYAPPDFVRPDPRFEEADFRAEAERRLGRALGAREVSSYWAAQAFAEMAAAPGAELARTWRKVRLFFHQYETPDNDDVELVAEYSPVLRLPFMWMGELFPLALLGAVIWWRRSRGARILSSAALAFAAGVLAFFVLSRFRIPLAPLLAVLGAGGVAWIEEVARARNWRRAAAGAMLVAAAAAFAYATPDWLDAKRRSALAVAFHDLGTQLAAAGDEEGALRAYDRAVATDEGSVVASLRALGELRLARGEFDAAEHAMRRVVEIKPSSLLGWQALLRLYQKLLRDDRYGGDAALPGKLIVALQAVVRLGPYDEGTRYYLGSFMETHATAEEMIAYYAAAAAADPKPQTSLYFWAVGLERAGDLDGAIAKLREALEVDPAHEMSEHRWGAILEREGRLAEALEHYATATEIHPEFRAAHESCARVLTVLGRDAEARAHLEAAAASDPNTPRRYVYWARYLAAHGRVEAAVAELQRALHERPGDAEARALLDELRPGAGAGAPDASPPSAPASPTSRAPGPAGPLDSAAHAALVSTLRAEPAGAPLWLAVFDRDAASAALGAALRDAFAEAGWTVRAVRSVPFGMKAGTYLFVADEAPPPYVRTAHDALVAAGFAPTIGTGYRSYYEEMVRTKPGFQGFALDADQTYLLVVGPSGAASGASGAP